MCTHTHQRNPDPATCARDRKLLGSRFFFPQPRTLLRDDFLQEYNISMFTSYMCTCLCEPVNARLNENFRETRGKIFLSRIRPHEPTGPTAKPLRIHELHNNFVLALFVMTGAFCAAPAQIAPAV